HYLVEAIAVEVRGRDVRATLTRGHPTHSEAHRRTQRAVAVTEQHEYALLVGAARGQVQLTVAVEVGKSHRRRDRAWHRVDGRRRKHASPLTQQDRDRLIQAGHDVQSTVAVEIAQGDIDVKRGSKRVTGAHLECAVAAAEQHANLGWRGDHQVEVAVAIEIRDGHRSREPGHNNLLYRRERAVTSPTRKGEGLWA